VNYYANVRPRQQFQDAFNRQEQIDQEYAQDFAEGVLTTGHRSSFQNHQRYFQTNATAGSFGHTGQAARAGSTQQQSQANQQGSGRSFGAPSTPGAGRARY
jgi:hypothetical protein